MKFSFKRVGLGLCLLLIMSLVLSTVSAQVSYEIQVSVACNRTAADVGDSLRWTAVVYGGQQPYLYSFYLYKDGKVVQKTPYTSNNSFNFVPKQGGNYFVTVIAKDAKAKTRSRTSEHIVVNQASPLVANVSVNSTDMRIGDSIVWNAQAHGGLAPYTYSYQVTLNGVKVSSRGYTNDQNMVYMPTEAGVYQANVYVKDSIGQVRLFSSPKVNVVDVVSSPLNISHINVNKSSAVLEDMVTWNVVVSGGRAPYNYRFEINQNNQLLETIDYSVNSSVSLKPTQVGIYTIKVFVKDANDTVVFQSGGESVVRANPLSASIVSDKIGLKNNQLVTWTVNASGGLSPYEFRYVLYRDGKEVLSKPYSSEFRYAYNPIVPGVYKMNVMVRDARGVVSNYVSSSDVTVEPYIEVKLDKLTLSTEQPVVNQAFNASISASEGTLPYTYAFYVYRNGSIVQKIPYSSKNNVNILPKDAGIYTVIGFVRDASNSTSVKRIDNINIVALPLEIVSSNANQASVDIGKQITWTTKAVGGINPLRYSFYLYKDGNRIEKTNYSTSNVFSYTPRAEGKYHVLAYVLDGQGVVKSKQGQTVQALGYRPISGNVYTDKPQYNLGETVRVSAKAVGGIAPYTYSYYVYSGGKLISRLSYSQAVTRTFKPSFAGNYVVLGFASDNAKNTKQIGSKAFTVSSSDLSINTTSNKTNTTTGDNFTVAVAAKGGLPPYTYAYYVYVDGRIAHKQAYKTNNTLLVPTPSKGRYTVTCFVRDKNGKIVSQTSPAVNVYQAGVEPLQIKLESNAANNQVGKSVVWNVSAWGGKAPYKYTYTLRLNNKQIASISNSSNRYSFVPKTAGTYSLIASVTDSRGISNEADPSYVYVKAAEGLSATLSASKNNAKVGENVSFNISNISGGVAPYLHTFYVYQNGKLISSAPYGKSSSKSVALNAPGTYTIVGFVKDSVGAAKNIASVNVKVEANEVPKVELNSVSVNKTNANVGDTLTFTAKASSGTEPYSYAFYVYVDNALLQKSAYSKNASISIKPEVEGTYYVTAFVRDALGSTASLSSARVKVVKQEVVVTEINLQTNFQASQDPAKIGTQLTWSANASGGVGNYTYAYYVYLNGVAVQKTGYTSNSSYTFTANQAGTYFATVFVRDSNGNVKSRTGQSIQVEN